MTAWIFRIYRVLVFPVLWILGGGGAAWGCRHEPSCSRRCERAIAELGWWRGMGVGLRQFLRCHPWSGSV